MADFEHPFRTIRKMMAAAGETGAYPRLLLLCGREEFLLRWALSYLKEELVSSVTEALDYSYFSGEDLDIYDVIAACETLPMFSTRKLVAVDAEKLLTGSKNDGGSAGSAELAEYLPKIPESCCLVLVSSKVNKTRSLYKACEKYGIVYDFVPLDGASLGAWMQKRFQSAGLSADRQMMLSFAYGNGYGEKDSDYDLYSLENDLKKVIAYADGPVVRESDFRVAESRRLETDAFRLLDSAFSGEKAQAYQILDNSIELSQPSKAQGVLLQLTGLLASQLELMLEYSERKAEGQSYQQIAQGMGINKYRLDKLIPAANRRSINQLKRNLFDVLKIDRDMKSGIIDIRLALELFIAGL